MVDTSGQLAFANLDQLGGSQAAWPGQDFIVQMQVNINPNSQGDFGIDFQPEGNGATGYFAFLINPPSSWSFNYYTAQGGYMGPLISGGLPSSVSTQATIDIRVQGTSYRFYINGVDTTGLAVTGSQYIDKIIGIAVDGNADITFSNLAIYALP